MKRSFVCAFGALSLCVVAACGDEPAPRPNIVFVVWDTVRADHTSLYGYARKTTPFLDEFAKNARVYDDCISAGSWTVPSHASMFTGLLPGEHGAQHGHEYLDDGFVTLAERLRDSGYQTFAWAANPHVSSEENFLQGFEVEQHPWDEASLERAIAIFKAKLPDSTATNEMRERADKRGESRWVVKAAGELGREGFLAWEAQRDKSRPFFAFFNYMEAHRPLIPPRKFREQLLTPAQVEATYATEFTWPETWAYCFGVHEYEHGELDVLRDVYDAALLELDALFAELVRSLEERGLADNTVIVLIADHGEHLGDGHLIDHQYSVAQALVHVPLVVRYPAKFAPGRETRPVMNVDVFPTLLELAQTDAPKLGVGAARSLLDPKERRPRLTDYSKPFPRVLESMRKSYPERDIARFERGAWSLVDRPWKLVQEPGGPSHLYDLAGDPHEERDVAAEQPAVVQRMKQGLDSLLGSVQPFSDGKPVPRSKEHEQRLGATGYADGTVKPKPTDGAPKEAPPRDER